MGRIQAVFSPTIVVASLLSTSGAGIAAALLQRAELYMLGLSTAHSAYAFPWPGC
jgi:hypothetical protein